MAHLEDEIKPVVVDIRGVSCCMPPVGEFIIEMRRQPENAASY